MEKVKIVNGLQATMYISHNVKPIDIFVGYGNKLVYVFDKKETKEVWRKWLNYEFNYGQNE